MKLDVTALSPRIRNPVLLGLGAVVLFLLLAAYGPLNPALHEASNNELVRNILGSVGTFLSNLLVGGVGYAAYAIPVILMGKILSIVLHERESRKWIGALSVLGFALVIASLCWLVGAWIGFPSEAVRDAGGVVGFALVSATEAFIPTKIAAVLATVVLMFGLQLAIRFSWLVVFGLIGKFVYFSSTKVAQAVVGFVKELRAFKRSRRTPNLARTGVATRTRREPNVETSANTTATAQTAQSKRKDPTLGARSKPTSKTQTPTKPRAATRTTTTPLKMKSPDLGLLETARAEPVSAVSKESIRRIADQLAGKLADFGVDAEVVSVLTGPVVTRFEIQPAPGLKASKISGIAKDLARALAVMSVRIVEVIPGKSVVGVEIPNDERSLVSLREVMQISRRSGVLNSPLDIVLGRDVSGEPVIASIEKMPHVLVAGTTGSGKSVCINAILVSLLLQATPEQVKLIMIDPKMLELSVYDEIPHLLAPVVTDMQDAHHALGWCVAEMERRYQLMASLSVRNVSGYNALIEEAQKSGEEIVDPIAVAEGRLDAEPLQKLPSIVVVVDELADMMMIVGKKVEQLICRIAQKARAAGIHLILATQRPSVDVLTGLIKSNIPCRISFYLSSKIDSRTILDQGGAEQLLGHGDMLYLPPGSGVPVRVHGAFVSDHEVIRVADHWREQGGEPEYIAAVTNGEVAAATELTGMFAGDDDVDEHFNDAVEFVQRTRRVSISSVQRKFRIGYNRAARIVESMEEAGIVSSPDDSGNRQVLAQESAAG